MKTIEIDLSQTLYGFLERTLVDSKTKKNRVLTRFCNALVSAMITPNSSLPIGTFLEDLLQVERRYVFGYRGVGQKGYIEFCRLFLDCQIKIKSWAFFKEYIELQKKNRQAVKSNVRPLKIKVKAVRVKTDPETKVFQITIDGGKGVGIWKETAYSPRGVLFFFRGLQAMTCFAGLPILHLPEIPEAN